MVNDTHCKQAYFMKDGIWPPLKAYTYVLYMAIIFRLSWHPERVLKLCKIEPYLMLAVVTWWHLVRNAFREEKVRNHGAETSAIHVSVSETEETSVILTWPDKENCNCFYSVTCLLSRPRVILAYHYNQHKILYIFVDMQIVWFISFLHFLKF